MFKIIVVVVVVVLEKKIFIYFEQYMQLQKLQF
jgi:hypothetical protein